MLSSTGQTIPLGSARRRSCITLILELSSCVVTWQYMNYTDPKLVDTSNLRRLVSLQYRLRNDFRFPGGLVDTRVNYAYAMFLTLS